MFYYCHAQTVHKIEVIFIKNLGEERPIVTMLFVTFNDRLPNQKKHILEAYWKGQSPQKKTRFYDNHVTPSKYQILHIA